MDYQLQYAIDYTGYYSINDRILKLNTDASTKRIGEFKPAWDQKRR